MFKNIKSFILHLQNSDEATKKRWLIGVSAITMIFVISGWLVYLNYTIEKIGAPEDNEIAHSTSFWQVFKTGLIITGQSIKDKTKNLISEIMDKIKSKNTIIIEK
ncbi:MAG: hypothetical protein V3T98_01120 [Candidatus Paceibacterota bacterium]